MGWLSSPLSPWFAKAVILAASIAMIAIRAPHGSRSRRVPVVQHRKGPLEVVLLTLAMLGFIIPMVWLVTPAFWFAEYPLYFGPLAAGTAFLIAGLYLFHLSHCDLGVNWSVTLEVRQQHQLVTRGVYQRVRHPMYTALFLYSLGQMLALPNWVAGPSCLATFGILFFCRLRAEENMMLDTFGDDYRDYMLRTKRIVPYVW